MHDTERSHQPSERRNQPRQRRIGDESRRQPDHEPCEQQADGGLGDGVWPSGTLGDDNGDP